MVSDTLGADELGACLADHTQLCIRVKFAHRSGRLLIFKRVQQIVVCSIFGHIDRPEPVLAEGAGVQVLIENRL